MADSAPERDESEIIIWIPYDNDPEYKVTITLADSTVVDITNDLDEGTVVLMGPPNLSTFSGKINNADGTYSGLLLGGEILTVYIERAVDPTVKVFEGHLDYPGKFTDAAIEIKLFARAHEVIYQDTRITKSYIDEKPSDVLIDLLTYKTSEFTTTGITDTPATTISIEFDDTPIQDAISQVLDKINHSMYFTATKDAVSFPTGSVTNEDDAFVAEQNLFYVSGFGPDTSQVINKVRVYGAMQDGIPIISYYEDADSIDAYGDKELTIRDSSITTQAAADERAVAEVTIRKDAPEVGDAQGVGGNTFKPGQKANIYDPYNGVDGTYILTKITHDLRTEAGITTTLTVQKEIRKIAALIKQHDIGIRTASSSNNAADMNYSWTFTFDDNTGIQTLNGCTISEGSLISSSPTATVQTITKNLTNSPLTVLFLVRGESLGSAVLSYSLDGGSVFNTVVNNTVTAVSGSGTQLVLKVALGSSSAKIDTMSLSWK
jgi:hypothetical protein